MNPIEEYLQERTKRLSGDSPTFIQYRKKKLYEAIIETEYVKNWTWMGQPILQLPTDMFAMQELICRIEPDFVIETGVAFGGSLLFYASVMESIEWGQVIGVDIEIRDHNRKALMESPLWNRIHLIEGDSTSPETYGKVRALVGGDKVIVVLDSSHTHEHVLNELNLYSRLVPAGSYIVVFDTTIETMNVDCGDKPWGPGNNPMTAVREFLSGNPGFEADQEIEAQALLTSAEGGWLIRRTE